MARYQLLIEYVGTNFRGWQIQKKGSTIQGLIQEKLTKLLKEKIILNGSGRKLIQVFMQLNSLVILIVKMKS
jgi:tRNA pseudouridine38-40 synthase